MNKKSVEQRCQLVQYEESLKAYRDLKGVVDTSYEEGKAEGKVEGKIEGKIEMAIELKKKGVDIDTIAAASGLSKEEIEKL
jgi:predicted transposase/invertase (TIGR01784 family)